MFNLGSDQYLAVGINALLRVYSILRDKEEMEKLAEVDSQIITYKLKVVKEKSNVASCQILVADIMKSLTVYKFDKRFQYQSMRLSMEARDPNGLWCIEMA